MPVSHPSRSPVPLCRLYLVGARLRRLPRGRVGTACQPSCLSRGLRPRVGARLRLALPCRRARQSHAPTHPSVIRTLYSVIFSATATPLPHAFKIRTLYSSPHLTFPLLHRPSADLHLCTAFATHCTPYSVLCNLLHVIHFSTFAQELCSDLHLCTCLPPHVPRPPSSSSAQRMFKRVTWWASMAFAKMRI